MGQAKSKAAQPRMALTFPGDPDHGSKYSFFFSQLSLHFSLLSSIFVITNYHFMSFLSTQK